MTSWACLLGSGLKLIFHWNAQLLILLKSLIKWAAEVLISRTSEKREASSAKGLAFVDRSSERSLKVIFVAFFVLFCFCLFFCLFVLCLLCIFGFFGEKYQISLRFDSWKYKSNIKFQISNKKKIKVP